MVIVKNVHTFEKLKMYFRILKVTQCIVLNIHIPKGRRRAQRGIKLAKYIIAAKPKKKSGYLYAG